MTLRDYDSSDSAAALREAAPGGRGGDRIAQPHLGHSLREAPPGSRREAVEIETAN